MLKWYEYDQNNSGGKFHVDENLAQDVYIEADSIDSAQKKAKSIGIYFNGVDDGIDCSCCGDRWCRAYDNENLTYNNIEFKTIEEYVQYIANNSYNFTKPYAILHYNNGNKKEIFKEETKQ